MSRGMTDLGLDSDFGFEMDAFEMDDDSGDSCLNNAQSRALRISLTTIRTTFTLTTSTLSITAAFRPIGRVRTQLTQAARIIGAVNDELVAALSPIVRSTCGSCSQITTNVGTIVNSLKSTLGAAVPEWRTNPIFSSVTTVLSALIGLIPAFCPQPL